MPPQWVDSDAEDEGKGLNDDGMGDLSSMMGGGGMGGMDMEAMMKMMGGMGGGGGMPGMGAMGGEAGQQFDSDDDDELPVSCLTAVSSHFIAWNLFFFFLAAIFTRRVYYYENGYPTVCRHESRIIH